MSSQSDVKAVVVVVPQDDKPYIHQEDTVGALAEFIRSISANPDAAGCKIFPFIGFMLKITKGERRYLVNADGKRYPLFDEPDEVEDFDDSFDLLPERPDDTYKQRTDEGLKDAERKAREAEESEDEEDNDELTEQPGEDIPDDE